MEVFIPFLMAAVVGFGHAFEADHLVAVSNIVTRRNNFFLAIKDGIFWGLGHTSTILVAGCIFILGRIALHEADFRYFEATVGLMLVVLGSIRLFKQASHSQEHEHTHPNPHQLAYSVGLVHGLAGSGALLLSVLTQIKSSLGGLLYLLIFGLGSILGMMVAAGIFSVPFSGQLIRNQRIRRLLTWLSSGLCIGLGLMIIYQNLLVR